MSDEIVFESGAIALVSMAGAASSGDDDERSTDGGGGGVAPSGDRPADRAQEILHARGNAASGAQVSRLESLDDTHRALSVQPLPNATSLWSPSEHEHEVERIYTENANGFGGSHDGYLNFGLWSPGIRDYVAAAQNLVRNVGASIELDRRSRLLDVACGRGTQDVFLHQVFGVTEIDAVDVTRVHVDDGRRRAQLIGMADRLRFHHASAVALPFPASSFSHAIAIEGPVHFDTRACFAGEAFRCLEPGGRLAIADYVLKRSPRTAFERRVLSATLALWRIPDANVVDSDGYARMLEAIGFEHVEVREVGARTIPGYFREQAKLSFRLRKVREQGIWLGGAGFIVDVAVYLAFRLGLIEYVFVRARKPR